MKHLRRPISIFNCLKMNNLFGTTTVTPRSRTINIMVHQIKFRQFHATIQSIRITNKFMMGYTCKTLVSNSSKNVNQLSKIFQCSEEEVVNLFLNYNLENLNVYELQNCYEILQTYGLNTVTIKENIWILFFNIHKLTSRLELLVKWRFNDINNAVRLLQLPFRTFKRYTFQTVRDFDYLNGQNRMTYFSSFTKCKEKDASDLFFNYRFMMTINLDCFTRILEVTRDVGILTEDLLSDPWLFKYHPQVIMKRVQFLNAINATEKCKVIKPWMLRCPQSVVNRYFELRDENIAALGSYTNLKDLLTNELELSDVEVEGMLMKHPPLAKISYSKAKEMIDFLKSQGFSSKMICQVPRVLCHKQATLLARLLELKKINPRMLSLQNLCRNKKDYHAFIIKVQNTHS
ncbi:transcription termination factor, mitochondrial-like [Macrosteles quadrilineatus]|uniref:transcription termination factor, mitochondrial-like n=1 Tax=Macrosteles quadrilineatus TaxID=74068 RepID=UPI0023E24DE3|nr:transcription termination factor, mitochondrial-like [Macrosteles quadrilineatus]